MNTQKIKLGTSGSEKELSIVNRAFEHIPVDKDEVVETADSTKYVYSNTEKQRWRINWTTLPSDNADTLDENCGRDNLKAEYDKKTNLSLLIYDDETPQGYSSYTVIFTYYNEVYQRPLAGDPKDCWRYNISIELEET